MSTGKMIKSLREQNLMTQSDLACRLHVTRQAVSRWENGETSPGSDVLLSMSEIFGVSVDELLESKQVRYCECCGMPLETSIMGRDKNGKIDPRYCKWCLEDGRFNYENIGQMLDYLVKHMPHPNMSDEEARAFFKAELEKLPYWKDRPEGPERTI